MRRAASATNSERVWSILSSSREQLTRHVRKSWFLARIKLGKRSSVILYMLRLRSKYLGRIADANIEFIIEGWENAKNLDELRLARPAPAKHQAKEPLLEECHSFCIRPYYDKAMRLYQSYCQIAEIEDER
jgi:hypothetical protein